MCRTFTFIAGSIAVGLACIACIGTIFIVVHGKEEFAVCLNTCIHGKIIALFAVDDAFRGVLVVDRTCIGLCACNAFITIIEANQTITCASGCIVC